MFKTMFWLGLAVVLGCLHSSSSQQYWQQPKPDQNANQYYQKGAEHQIHEIPIEKKVDPPTGAKQLYQLPIQPVQFYPTQNIVSGPFSIQQPVLSHTGEIIIENTIGGIPFDCRFRPSGHWRDGKYCDVFHACVYGYHRKSYTCPIVGERTYFDEVTQKCEFVSANPAGCTLNAFYK